MIGKVKYLALCMGSALLMSCAHQMPAPPGKASKMVLQHEVQKGETLRTVGQQYATATRSIQRLNKLGSRAELKPGQIIYIPVSEKALESADLLGSGKMVPSPENLAEESNADSGRLGIEDDENSRKLEFPLVNGRIQSHFGPRGRRKHEGIDIFPRGTKDIVAASRGVVEFVGRKSGYGTTVVIKHNGFKTLYAHCSKTFVAKGQEVDAGDTIALVGATGNAHGAHLHFEYQNMKNVAMDPMPLLGQSLAH